MIELALGGGTNLTVTSPSATGTFTNFTTVTNFDAADRSDAWWFGNGASGFGPGVPVALDSTPSGTITAVDRGSVATTSQDFFFTQNFFYIDNATANLTSLSSVDQAIGVVHLGSVGFVQPVSLKTFFVILSDATASHFGVYEATANDNGQVLGTNSQDAIKLVAIFDHGFSAASYHAPI